MFCFHLLVMLFFFVGFDYIGDLKYHIKLNISVYFFTYFLRLKG